MEASKENRPVITRILNKERPRTILDAPSGDGWIGKGLEYDVELTGVDLFESAPEGYTGFCQADLDYGLPDHLGEFDAFVTCEGIEHVGNPLLLLEHAARHLVHGGLIIVTTPNTWFPASRLQFLIRGFFPSFPCLVGRIKRGTHMHITPWSFPHLFLYLKLAGYSDIQLHDVDEPKPRHFFERIFAMPQLHSCRKKAKAATDDEEREFWKNAGSAQSIFGRRLVVTARKRQSNLDNIRLAHIH
ncbi:MAG: methyltransferase domain-containing protein [Planctomycetota bacterium]|nr:MAG: methyltransferase domain-containing protein [Planctomycetota bacterium]